tara:strand:- start:474 stop:818 length:345 start_codon:yes stop_codon:yes gene_type:complete
MELDTRMIITLGGMLVSIVTAFTIVKQKLLSVTEHLADVETRLRSMDKVSDEHEIEVHSHSRRLDVIAGMLSPKEREVTARETASILAEISSLRRELDKLTNMHSGKHPAPHVT